MRDIGIVKGDAIQAVPIVVGKDTIYIHENIQLIPNGEYDSELYEYHEIQYDKDEYILMMAQKNEIIEKQLADTQLALCEIYEGVV